MSKTFHQLSVFFALSFIQSSSVYDIPYYLIKSTKSLGAFDKEAHRQILFLAETKTSCSVF